MQEDQEGGKKSVDRHEEKVIKPGFRQAFMSSQTQTPFEAGGEILGLQLWQQWLEEDGNLI